jgi:peptidoglycan/LPS O-acetylase OafA/YrhL
VVILSFGVQENYSARALPPLHTVNTTPKTPFDRRENNFDFIRISLAMLVIFSHSYLVCTGSEAGDPFNILTRGQVTGGHIAVDLFFIISGFLITASFERSTSILGYLGKRVRRIYPAFIVVMVLSALFFVPLAGGRIAGASPSAQALNVLTHALRLRDFDATPGLAGNPYPTFLNASLWSISYEFYCYLGVVLLGISGLLRSGYRMAVLLALAIGVSVAFCLYGWQPSGGAMGRVVGLPLSWARLVPMFLAGTVFHRLRERLPLTKFWIALACALLLVAARTPHLWIVLFPMVGGYLILALAYHPLLRQHRWGRYGDFSYGTYLYAFPIQQLILQWIGHAIAPCELFLLAVPPTLVCAAMSWHGVEKWFIRPAATPQPSLDVFEPARAVL